MQTGIPHRHTFQLRGGGLAYINKKEAANGTDGSVRWCSGFGIIRVFCGSRGKMKAKIETNLLELQI